MRNGIFSLIVCMLCRVMVKWFARFFLGGLSREIVARKNSVSYLKCIDIWTRVSLVSFYFFR